MNEPGVMLVRLLIIESLLQDLQDMARELRHIPLLHMRVIIRRRRDIWPQLPRAQLHMCLGGERRDIRIETRQIKLVVNSLHRLGILLIQYLPSFFFFPDDFGAAFADVAGDHGGANQFFPGGADAGGDFGGFEGCGAGGGVFGF